MRVLVHVCCAPCSILFLDRLEGEGFSPRAFWYNPNIHPFTEYKRRMEEVLKIFPDAIVDDYEFIEYLRRVAGREERRCEICYDMRLSRTAEVARRENFPLFTTTLLISPYQNLELIKAKGEDAGRRFGVEFLFRDMRDIFRESHRLAREKGIYLQKYCGCIYSEYERFKCSKK